MPKKRRDVKAKQPDFSNTALFVASGGLWGDGNDLNEFEKLIYEFPAICSEKCLVVWRELREDVLMEWVKAYPGTRPAYWWHFDAPLMSAAQVVRQNWDSCDFAADLREPRQRISGTGTPQFECLNVVPSFKRGIPDVWVTDTDNEVYGSDFAGVPVDRLDPPVFESEAAYLKRNGLLLPGEERRLSAAAYEPEILKWELEEETK